MSEEKSNKKAIRKAVLLDADYITRKDRAVIRLIMKGKKMFQLYDGNFSPYFYLDGEFPDNFNDARMVGKEKVKKIVLGKEKEVWKIVARHPREVPELREAIKQFGETYEYDIPFAKRYLIDKDLFPFMELKYEREGKKLTRIISKTKKDSSLKDFNTLVFDIETYNPQGIPREKQDPILMIGYEENGSLPQKKKLMTSKKLPLDFIEHYEDEKSMLEGFTQKLKEKDIEILFGYNSSAFDLPYMRARADALKTNFLIGRDSSSFKIQNRGFYTVAKVNGRMHLDVYPIVRFFGIIGALKITSFTLENVYAEMSGKRKMNVEKMKIWELWDQKPEVLAKYCSADVMATSEIIKRFIPTIFALSKTVGLSLFDISSSTSSLLVETLLMREASKENMVSPNRPKGYDPTPIKGAYVKLPEPGVYENMIVFDFRGLYPSIICSHNVDPFTIDCEGEAFVSPLGHRFCKDKMGLVPKVLGKILELRAECKKKLKTLSRNSEEYEKINAMQQALKILANSFYGYLLYVNSRWYSRRCGESITAWGRYYISETAKKAEERGFKVLYIDTDSLFILLGDKKKEEALSFLDSINCELPGNMELEFEGFYPRGVFVSKKAEEKGAKKKYALLGEDGTIKIRGFELVRRDWARIAKDTQKSVLEIILKEGSKEKAVKLVKDVVERLRTGEVPMEELVIYSTLRKKPGNYDILSPELGAAQKAIARGKKIEKGTLIGYVVTKKGKSISEKAELLEFAQDYDSNYYINHQIIPAVMKILSELGYSEEDLKSWGKQQTLDLFS